MTFALVITIAAYPLYASEDTNMAAAMSLADDAIQPEFVNSLINGSITVGETNQVKSNPEFVLVDNQSGIIGYALPSYWNDPQGSCINDFECSVNFTTGWHDNSSLQVSTKTNT